MSRLGEFNCVQVNSHSNPHFNFQTSLNLTLHLRSQKSLSDSSVSTRTSEGSQENKRSIELLALLPARGGGEGGESKEETDWDEVEDIALMAENYQLRQLEHTLCSTLQRFNKVYILIILLF